MDRDPATTSRALLLEDRDPVRIAAVPAAHPYVRAVTAASGIEVLPDPVVDPAHPERWWPPAVLEPEWIAEHADALDLVHVHFGMESLPPGRLDAALDALEAAGVPLVHTVHDLDNPQLHDQRSHRADLDRIVPRADALVTLTDEAARRIRDAWGREALVLPHPTLLATAAPAPRRTGDQVVVGTHLRDLRPSIDAEGAARGLLAAVSALRAAGTPAIARLHLNERTRDDARAARLVDDLADRPWCEVVVRPRPDDAALLAELDALDLALLPYGHGTHSGWVELCHDRGIPVLGPAGLPMARQHPGDYAGFEGWDGAGAAALAALAAAPPAGTPERARLVAHRARRRAAERELVAHAHLELYRRVVAGGRR
ncbi:glycosyltransferase [Agrococcus terreus]|uniref:Glycosyltransferase subfamily 4-like N-terminal domain-containing protein n=1 Tax=Agrococcus terreus TaxID=574649 RepID=A0ABQ2KMZ8_9MICO|nr:glycosyltransferase [Agrococcus terreus]GGN88166.1 hypothetical protein GCM10010968_23470 [Agrococcus terreus]